MKIFDWLFGKKPEPVQEEVREEVIDVEPENNDNAMACHYCGKGFEVTPKMIFPTSVRLLYKDQFVTGKGVTCPHCFKDCIFG